MLVKRRRREAMKSPGHREGPERLMRSGRVVEGTRWSGWVMVDVFDLRVY